MDGGGWSRKCLVAVLCVVAAIALFPLLVGEEQASVRIQDHLDSDLVLATMLRDRAVYWSGSTVAVPGFMGGVPRGYLRGPFDLVYLVYQLLPPFFAYVANELFIRVVAALGMFLVVRDDCVRTVDGWWLGCATALPFALVPFWPPGGLSVAGVPLVAWALLRVRDGTTARWSAWACIVLFAGYSTFPFSGAFVFFVWSGVVAVDAGRKRWAHARRGVAALAVLSAAYGLTLWHPLSLALFHGGLASHRTEIVTAYWPLTEVLPEIRRHLQHGQLHAVARQWPIIMPTVAAALVAAWLTRRKRAARALAVAVLLLVSFAAWKAAWYSYEVQAVWRASGLPSFNLSRFYVLGPALWYGAFAVSGSVLVSLHRRLLAVFLVLCAAQCVVAWREDRRTRSARLDVSFDEFFAPSLFAEIEQTLATRQRGATVSVGLHPSIAAYNGLPTLDGYLPTYPLEYKRRFRRVIAPALEADQEEKRYFDQWGSRAYVFNRALKDHGCRFTCGKARAPPAEIDLLVDPAALRSLGGRFVLSVSRIGNATDLGLAERGVFDRPDSAWRLYLYEL